MVLALLSACASQSGDSSEAKSLSADDSAVASGSFAESGDAPAAPSEAAAESTDQKQAGRAPLQTSLINTGNVSLRSDDVDQATFDVQKIVDKYRGQIANSSTSNNTATKDGEKAETRFVRMTLRVPAANFTKTFEELKQVAERVSADSTSEDVTTQVIDTEVRIRAQERSLKRIEVLLDRATDIGDIVNIESELTRRQADLDSLKQQQTYLADQTSLSTITVSIELDKDAKKKAKKDDTDDTGFLSGLKGGWDAMITVGTAAATVTGAVLPFAGLALLIGLPAWVLIRRRRPTGATA